MKISLFVHDLASNPVGRVAPIAYALELLGHQVEVLGFLLSGDQVYLPYRQIYPYKTIRCSAHFHTILKQAPALAAMATGELIYSFKPLWTSFWPALLAARSRPARPILLDIDDDEWWFQDAPSLRTLLRDHLLRGWNYALSPKYTLLLHPFARRLKQKTVVSTRLQRRYGGNILLHGPDARLFDPQGIETSQEYSRNALGLAPDKWLVFFVGTPHPHKGIDVLVQALLEDRLQTFDLVLAGPSQHPIFVDAKKRLGERCHLLGFVPYTRLPALLKQMDIVVIPQLRSAIAEAQVPAKLLDAMSMARIIVASSVSDIPQLLGVSGSEPRGWVVPPGDAAALGAALQAIVADPVAARRRGEAARRYYLAHASTEAIARKLEPILLEISRSSPPSIL